jgi:hypothetical protein
VIGEPVTSSLDECYRCGYDLHGILDEQACPECGLLARRSRRPTDELFNSRPKWLRGLSRGIKLILLGLLVPIALPFVYQVLQVHIGMLLDVGPLAIFLVAPLCALLILIGVWMLTRREGYPPADEADRRSRAMLRLVALALLLIASINLLLFPVALMALGSPPLILLEIAGLAGEYAYVLGGLVFSVLIFLLFRRLGSLARRARSAHLAEHCTIVGIGASASVLYAVVILSLANRPQWLGLDPNWFSRPGFSLVVSVILYTAAGLFFLWAIYLLIRFAIALHRAAKNLRGQWKRDDRSAIGTL